jgi:hypothetical protein
VAAEGKRGDDAEVPATTAQRPEQVGMGGFAGGHERPVSQDHIGREQVVYRQAEAPGEVADTSAERQVGHSGGCQESGGGGHAERHRGMVYVSLAVVC